jgi:hypothetical protein
VSEAGLTLLEVIAATAIVLMTVTAVTTVTVGAARASSRSRGRAAADAALLAEAARLRALPFFVPLPVDWALRRETTTRSAVGELFPHADASLNADDGRFLISGPRAGAFETAVVVQGITIRRTTWMTSCEASGWRSAAMTALGGWRAWGGAAVPGEALLVRLDVCPQRDAPSADDDSRLRGLTFMLSAGGRAGPVDPETPTEGPGEWAP